MAYNTIFITISVKPSGYSSPLEGERANDCNGSCSSRAVRGQKTTSNKGFKIISKAKRNKIKKSSFLEFFHFNFLYKLKIVFVISFLTPHGSQIATTVAILSPALPQGES
jgi:hypothetical protein